MLSFELLLDKYRKEVINSCFEEQNYWLQKSNDTYERLVSMYHLHSLQRKQSDGNQSPGEDG